MKKNILLVDDDKIFNFLSEKTIQSLGLANEINFASNGNKPWNYLNCKSGKMQRPDIIFLDLDMPVMNGYEFLEEFSKIDIPKKIYHHRCVDFFSRSQRHYPHETIGDKILLQ